STVWSIRGDDFIYEYGVTEKYTGTAHITVIVHDRNGEPVDGACVVMESEYLMEQFDWPSPMIAIWNYTDLEGRCEFDLGGNYYTIDVMSEIGNYYRNRYHVVEGRDDTLILTIDGEMPGMPEISALSREGKGAKIKLTLKDVHVIAQSILTYPDDTVVITGNGYPQSITGGMGIFVCDENNFQRFLKGYDFDCVQRFHVTGEVDFRVPKGEWYVILCNRYSLSTVFEAEVRVG
ncbi:MAG: hypothetical protein KAU14_05105, partial [Thermoplasmata archaeon]|nr:hypothetical protein [Thermoplasmata archaeon]